MFRRPIFHVAIPLSALAFVYEGFGFGDGGEEGVFLEVGVPADVRDVAWGISR